MALLARIVAVFVSTGLLPRDIETSKAHEFIDVPTDKKAFEAVLDWMLDEGIIRAKHVGRFVGTTTIKLLDAQLTAKGLSIVKHPLDAGDTIEKRIQNADKSSGNWSGIGDLIGGFAGGFIKSMSSG